MLALLLFIVFGLIFGYFSTLNTSLVSLHLGPYAVTGIPIYLLVLVSLGLGVLFASLFYFIKSLSTKFTINKKEGELERTKKELALLTKELHKLELENTRLKVETGEEGQDEESL